jgi:hypothetical protein
MLSAEPDLRPDSQNVDMIGQGNQLTALPSEIHVLHYKWTLAQQLQNAKKQCSQFLGIRSKIVLVHHATDETTPSSTHVQICTSHVSWISC